MKLFYMACVLIAGMALSGVACAIGMGGIKVSSALGEPLNAEIELAGIGSKASKDSSLTARIASPDAFKVAGLEYPTTLPSLKFSVEWRPDGEPYLKITSLSPVNDPFVSLLVELNWSSGRLLREYTFLLDPPGFKPEQPAEPMVQPMAPVAVAETPNISAEAVKIEPAPEIVKAPVVSSATSGKKAASAGRTSSGKITVKRGDTLSKIARQVKSSDISLDRMLVALYRANADEFDGKNMNRLRVGKILRMPNNADVEQMTQADAIEEIHTQTADWNAYRQKLAAASVTAKEPTSGQEVSGKITTKVADKTPSAKESAKEVVKLSKGIAPGDKTVSGSSLTAKQDKINGLQEDLIARNSQLKDSNNRIAMLEKNIKEMQHLLDLKSQNMASSNQTETQTAPPSAAPIIEAKPQASAMPSGVTTAPLSTDNEAQQANSAAKPKPAPPKVVPPPPSMMDKILDEPLYLAGIVVVVLLLLGGGLMVVRRNRTRSTGWSKVEHNIAEPVAPSAEVGEITQPSRPISAAPMYEEVDPVTEADLFLNFGRDTQAEEILKDALEKDSTNQRILLKLLSIYLERKDSKAFHAIVQQVRESGDADAWAQAAEMGRKLEPENPVYSGETGSGEAAIVVQPEQVPHEPRAPGLDLDLDFDKEQSGTGVNTVLVLDKPTAADSSALDFDLGADIAEIGSGVKADINEGTGEFSTGNKKTAQFDTLHGFIDISSKSMSLPLRSTDIEQPGTAGKAEPALEDFIDVTSKSLPFQGADIEQPGPAGKAVPALEDFFDISSKSMSLPLRSTDIEQPGPAGKAEPALEDFFDISSKSMSLPLRSTDIEQPGAAGEGETALEDFFDVSSKSMSLSLRSTDVDQPGTGGKGEPALEGWIDISSAPFPLRSIDIDKPETGGMVARAQNDGLNVQGIDLNLNEPATVVSETEGKDTHWTEVTTKIDLARAYQEMGDALGAHEILKEVMDEGDDQQRATAKAMLEKLSA